MVHAPPLDITPTPGSSRTDASTAAGKKFVLAHLSDPHMAWGAPVSWRELTNKRMLGYLGWKLRQSSRHREGILSALLKDLARAAPDHIAVTGDLTHLGLPSEFQGARRWLQTLGPPSRVTVVPGNHDAYVRADWNQTFALWADYMASDGGDQRQSPATGFDDMFPAVRVRSPIAVIGVCTARPNPPHLATGRVGGLQLERLESILEKTARGRFFRVMMIHHPPVSGIVSRRRRLTDSPSLLAVIGRCGTELVLHGHSHKTTCSVLRTPAGSTTVVGAPSASSVGRTHDRRAGYFTYDILPSESAWEVTLAHRIYSPTDDRFLPERVWHFRTPAGGG